MAERITQSVRFDVDESPRGVNGGSGWDLAQVRFFIRRTEGLHEGQISRHGRHLHVRQHEPRLFDPDSFKSHRGVKGVLFVTAEPLEDTNIG